MSIKDVILTLLRDGFILVFNQDKLDVVKTAQALSDAGFNNMEITCRINQPMEKVTRLKKELPDFIVGVASLIDSPSILATYNNKHPDDPLPTLPQAVDAGADYLVSAAGFRDESFTDFAGCTALIPGCGSVTEIATQFSKGANLCKLFPAKQLGGPAFIKAIDPAIHKTISIVPTGGTNSDNIPDYINAGVLVLGGSFSMIEKTAMKQIINEQNYKLLSQELKKVRRLINDCRKQKWPDIDFASASIEQIEKVTGRNFNLG